MPNATADPSATNMCTRPGNLSCGEMSLAVTYVQFRVMDEQVGLLQEPLERERWCEADLMNEL